MHFKQCKIIILTQSSTSQCAILDLIKECIKFYTKSLCVFVLGLWQIPFRELSSSRLRNYSFQLLLSPYLPKVTALKSHCSEQNMYICLCCFGAQCLSSGLTQPFGIRHCIKMAEVYTHFPFSHLYFAGINFNRGTITKAVWRRATWYNCSGAWKMARVSRSIL